MAIFARSKQATVYRAYLRGRMRAAGVLPDGEAKQYVSPELPTPLLVAFVLGSLADTEAPLPSEAEVEREVASRLAPPPPPAAPHVDGAPVRRWIGEPLPSETR